MHNTKIVIDTNVVLKWLPTTNEDLIEEASEIYREMKKQKIQVYAPSYLLIECLNILVNKRKIKIDQAIKAIERLKECGIEFIDVGAKDIKKLCLLTKKYNLSPYDIQFILVALKQRCKLVTADKKILDSCNQAISLLGY